MNLQGIDWAIITAFVVGLAALAIYARRFNKSVADFLVANRCAGRYLLSISQGIAGIGVVSFVAMFEMYDRAGLTATWWGFLSAPIGLFVAISGWLAYRYRETRAMTLAQLFEVRYSRNFRVFAGILAWTAGVINMGIFPAVTAKFFIYFCGLPQTFELFGLQVSTFVTIMIIELTVALVMTFLGGMIAIAITDFFQGIFCNVAFLVVLGSLFFLFDYDQIVSALQSAPEQASRINPFKMGETKGFNIWFFIMLAFTNFYALRVWQGPQAYNAAAKNAHEAKMAGIIGVWRGMVQSMILLMLPICAYTLLHHPDFAVQAQSVQEVVNTIDNTYIQKQVTVPTALGQILPVGILGLFAAVMLAAAISTDDTYLHSWGSIFIQDVVLPFRKKGFTPRQHMWLLRFSIFMVAAIVFTWSLWFKQVEYIWMYFSVTGAIFIGGGGAVLIGGLYWKRGSTAGAWGGMIVGCILATTGMAVQQTPIWTGLVPKLQSWFPHWQFLIDNPEKFPWNGMYINVFAIFAALATYIGLSLWSWLVAKKPAFNMDRMLHRGQYAIKGEHEHEITRPPTGLRALLPGKEFSRGDKFLHIALTCWSLGWLSFFIGGNIYQFLFGTSDNFWIGFWTFRVALYVILGTITTIWFLIGGLRDIKYLFRALRSAERNALDDGRVVDHRMLADVKLEKKTPAETAEPDASDAKE